MNTSGLEGGRFLDTAEAPHYAVASCVKPALDLILYVGAVFAPPTIWLTGVKQVSNLEI